MNRGREARRCERPRPSLRAKARSSTLHANGTVQDEEDRLGPPAEFLLDQVDGRRYLGRTVGLFSPRELKFGATADFQKLSAGMAERAAALNA